MYYILQALRVSLPLGYSHHNHVLYLSYLSIKANVLVGVSKVCYSHQLKPNLDSA